MPTLLADPLLICISNSAPSHRTPIISSPIHVHIPVIVFRWWATSYWRAAPLPYITSPASAMRRKGCLWWRWRERPSLKSFPFIEEGIPSTVPVTPVHWHWSIKLVPCPVVIFWIVSPPISPHVIIRKPAFVSGRWQTTSTKLPGAIPSPTTRRGPVAIHAPARRTFYWWPRKASWRTMWRRWARIASPRTSPMSIAKPVATVTVLPPCKIQVSTPEAWSEISEIQPECMLFNT